MSDPILSAQEVRAIARALRVLPTVSEEGEFQTERLVAHDAALRSRLAEVEADPGCLELCSCGCTPEGEKK